MGRKLLVSNDFVAEERSVHVESHSGDETLIEAMRRKYPAYADNLAFRFFNATGAELTWDSINLPNLDKFVQYLNHCGLSPNSVNQYCKKFKAVLNCYSDLHPMPNGFMKILNTTRDDSQEAYLTDKDVDILYSYLDKVSKSGKPHSDTRAAVLALFLVGLETGARYSDYMRFNANNVSTSVDTDGNEIKVITYVSAKTGVKAQVPIDPNSPIIPIIENMPKRNFTAPRFDRWIKVVCREAGLRRIIKRHHAGVDQEIELCDAISSHSARRSFCTNYLKRGANIVDVMHFMGHTNTTQTLGYNCAAPQFKAKSIVKRKRSQL